jgi:PBP1b-binding outer membrane lipoprotein LpoB
MKPLIWILGAVLLLGGCTAEVKPWEKQTLAKETMSEAGSHTVIKRYEEHIFTSKEAAKGGSGVAGGGCGCN